ncbi:DeoR/GlpR family DNA-binding transcription regulator [Paenibacillus sp. P96]|uniref:DeoR/GlpR family DNA-binding transcription regulator n=1 Tax=Paenibacillus zeirhizosphaerae TaxID=2987519 RepID=A0ABT9FRB9_9BACL|nr:DeoR/GlpR family DNA-binding transcription regulator [Paenibacillus sp. P96]MDP4097283.1 DeoR/GlpR family DNA-binding transcription regulator [Paenibacillus sp. P96]
MNPLRRYEIIMEALLRDKEVTVNELSERLNVTGKTIREDLTKLEEQGLVVRVHGGAMLANREQYGVLPEQESQVKHLSEKKQIAAAASSLIVENDIIALDGGSTTLEIAKQLGPEPITVITNDVYIISELAPKDHIRLVVPGGYRIRNVLAGAEAVAFIQGLNVRKAFISSTAIHPENGLSVYTSDLIDFKRALIAVSTEVYAVTDHHKFGQTALRTFASLSDLTAMITDRIPDNQYGQRIRDTGVRIISYT